jgi:hypothetical protein
MFHKLYEFFKKLVLFPIASSNDLFVHFPLPFIATILTKVGHFKIVMKNDAPPNSLVDSTASLNVKIMEE